MPLPEPFWFASNSINLAIWRTSAGLVLSTEQRSVKAVTAGASSCQSHSTPHRWPCGPQMCAPVYSASCSVSHVPGRERASPLSAGEQAEVWAGFSVWGPASEEEEGWGRLSPRGLLLSLSVSPDSPVSTPCGHSASVFLLRGRRGLCGRIRPRAPPAGDTGCPAASVA